ncbi:hypothetical protein G8767_34755 [Rhodococcus sp. IC4_135]|uniref:exonuclease domain-containing protein n=1 Tax=Rhodococcus sp. IC4_135 TaxID=2715537 RepID=UPI00141EC0EE|nr:hypothetical protein [Rhodococcus sp. IC4_135]
MSAIVFLDTETTGLHPTTRRPWEIAMIRREPGCEDARLLIQVVDVDLSHADKSALAIGRFHERHNSDPAASFGSLPESAAARQVEYFTADAQLAGVNINFDEVTLDGMLRRHGLMPRWDYHLIDLPSMALGYLHGRAEESGLAEFRTAAQLPYKSYELSANCDVEPPSEDERHTAMGDAEWVRRWYDALTYTFSPLRTKP